MLKSKISIGKVVACLILCSILFKPIIGWKGYFAINIFAFLVFGVRNNRVRCEIDIFEKKYVLFYCFMVIAAFWAPKFPWYLLLLTLFFFVQILILRLSLFKSVHSIDKIFGFITECFSNSTVLICLYTLVVEGVSTRLGAITFLEVGTRIELSIDLYIACTLCFIEIVWREDVKRIKLYEIVRLIFLLICVCLNGTRKILLGIAVSLFLIMFYKDKNNFLKALRVIIITLIAVILGYYLIMNVPMLYEQIGKRLEIMINITFRGYGFEESIAERTQLREYALLLFKENPIFGVGTQGFQYYSRSYLGKFLYSHCNYTELLANLGILGFVFYYAMPITLFFEAHKCKELKYRALIYVLVITILIMDYGQVSYYQIQYMLMYQLMAIFIMNSKNRVQ